MPVLFEEINSKIQAFIVQQKTDFYGLEDKDHKLPLSDAVFCATDTPRNRAFFEAIGKALQALRQKTPKPHVLYAGSGTGILGFFALVLGADSCFFLEHNPHSLEFSQRLAIFLGLEERIIFQRGDATEFIPPQKYDLLISETLTSGFVREDFPFIVNHLRNYAKPHAIILPAEFLVTATEKDRFGTSLAQQSFRFKSLQGFIPRRIRLQHLETTELSWITESTLYDDIKLRSGDAVSYLNETHQQVENFNNPCFRLEKFDGNKEKS